MTDELRDADGCEDYESMEESGLHTEAETEPDAQQPQENADQGDFAEEDIPFDETDDGEPEIVEESPLEKELADTKEKYMRLFAEFDNYRKRTAKEKSETYQDAVAKTVLELLPAVDSFELALKAPCSDEAYRTGMEKIYQQMTMLLTKLGVEEIPAQGEPFDPKLHNAIRQVEDENFGESTVCEVYQKGYTLGSRQIRPAMVAVAN